MEVLKFAHPEWFYALWAVPLLALLMFWALRRRRAMLEKFASSALLHRLMPGFRAGRWKLKTVLWLIAFCLFVIALADPQIGTRLEEVKREGLDIIVALDLSQSMLAEDVAPNRLEKAKYEVGKLIDILEGDRIGLVAFSGIAHVQCPLTLDYAAARLFLRMMDHNLIPQPGTAIGDAIETAVKAFETKEEQNKVLILITDGEDHEGAPVEAAREAAEKGVIIYTIGIGRAEGVPIPVYDNRGRRSGYKKDRDGNVVTTRLDVNTLREIAVASGGEFYQSTTGDAELRAIYDEVNKLEKKELTSRQFAQYEHRFQILLALGFLLIVLETMIPLKRSKQYEQNS